MKMKEILLQRPVISFFIITLLWSELIWVVVLPYFNVKSDSDWFWVGELGPGLVALLLSWVDKGRQGVFTLIKPFTYWRVHPFYYYLVIVLAAIFYLSVIGASGVFQGKSIPTITKLYPTVYFEFLGIKFYGLWMIPVFTIFYFFCEEIGWREYALPKLMQRYNALTAAIIIGILWSLFHLPLMNYSVIVTHPLYLVSYFLYTIMSSAFLSWLYLNTKGSLLLVSLSHAVDNTYGAFSPTIISSLGQGESNIVIFIRFLAYLPIFILLFRQRKIELLRR